MGGTGLATGAGSVGVVSGGDSVGAGVGPAVGTKTVGIGIGVGVGKLHASSARVSTTKAMMGKGLGFGVQVLGFTSSSSIRLPICSTASITWRGSVSNLDIFPFSGRIHQGAGL
jgi:hypothetical protein